MDPDPVTFVTVLNACASVMALEEGRHVHEQIIQSVCESIIFEGNSLADIYANTGAWRMHTECSSGCLHMMWSLGMPRYVDM